MTEKKKNSTLLIILAVAVLAGAAVYGYMKYLPEEGGSEDSKKAAISEDLLAKAQKAEQAGDTEEALEYYQEFLEINAQLPDNKNSKVGGVYASMGSIYFKSFKYPKALEHFQKALDHALQHLGKRSQEAGERWFSLASIYDKQGEVKQALEHYQNSQAIQAKLGADTTEVDKLILQLEDYMVNVKLNSKTS